MASREYNSGEYYTSGSSRDEVVDREEVESEEEEEEEEEEVESSEESVAFENSEVVSATKITDETFFTTTRDGFITAVSNAVGMEEEDSELLLCLGRHLSFVRSLSLPTRVSSLRGLMLQYRPDLDDMPAPYDPAPPIELDPTLMPRSYSSARRPHNAPRRRGSTFSTSGLDMSGAGEGGRSNPSTSRSSQSGRDRDMRDDERESWGAHLFTSLLPLPPPDELTVVDAQDAIFAVATRAGLADVTPLFCDDDSTGLIVMGRMGGQEVRLAEMIAEVVDDIEAEEEKDEMEVEEEEGRGGSGVKLSKKEVKARQNEREQRRKERDDRLEQVRKKARSSLSGYGELLFVIPSAYTTATSDEPCDCLVATLLHPSTKEEAQAVINRLLGVETEEGKGAEVMARKSTYRNEAIGDRLFYEAEDVTWRLVVYLYALLWKGKDEEGSTGWTLDDLYKAVDRPLDDQSPPDFDDDVLSGVFAELHDLRLIREKGSVRIGGEVGKEDEGGDQASSTFNVDLRYTAVSMQRAIARLEKRGHEVFFALRDSIPRPFESEVEKRERAKERDTLRAGAWRAESSLDRKKGFNPHRPHLSSIPEKEEGGGGGMGDMFAVATSAGEESAPPPSEEKEGKGETVPAILGVDDLQKLAKEVVPPSQQRKLGGRKRSVASSTDLNGSAGEGEPSLMVKGVDSIMDIIRGIYFGTKREVLQLERSLQYDADRKRELKREAMMEAFGMVVDDVELAMEEQDKVEQYRAILRHLEEEAFANSIK